MDLNKDLLLLTWFVAPLSTNQLSISHAAENTSLSVAYNTMLLTEAGKDLSLGGLPSFFHFRHLVITCPSLPQ
uniref:Putative secreted protein n=1 Tax=Panstrongylus lignarius TaxID=156445 RepID=A0A224Y5M7_9HEMI